MISDINTIVSRWEEDEKIYAKLGKLVVTYLNNKITDLEILPSISFRIKDLLSIIRKIKKKQLTKPYKYEDLKDKLGIRIICNFSEEMEIIDKFISENFIVNKPDRKREKLDYDKLDYISNHYDLTINVYLKYFKKYTYLKDLVFELQVRTFNQHAWSNTSHALSYKQEANISNLLKRKVFRLLSLYEIADDEFSIVNKELLSNPQNDVYSLLRKIEGKIYKYAKTDFDREYTLYSLGILKTFFKVDDWEYLCKNIEKFILENENKIKAIFIENKKRYHLIPFLIQPEIFIIWFALEKYFFAVDDNWRNNFDEDDLEQIRTLWGKTFE